MSHITRVRTTLRDAHLLAAALKEAGYPYVQVHDNPVPMRDSAGQPRRMEVIVQPTPLYGGLPGIRFARSRDGSFEAIMDTGLKRRFGSQLLPRITQAYGHAAALKYAQDHGYEVVTDESETDGTRRLTLRRYA